MVIPGKKSSAATVDRQKGRAGSRRPHAKIGFIGKLGIVIH